MMAKTPIYKPVACMANQLLRKIAVVQFKKPQKTGTNDLEY